MAISALRLNVAANTSRALADFSKFSQSLDNKFLVSGLKLDFVRSALSQINRDFTRAIGEQGLASASSLRAAQNQAALLTQTFKGFSVESALAISTNIGTALNNVAVRAGGTMKDVQRTLAATPFISTRIGEDMRQNLTKGMMAFQRDMRRAGLGENFGGTAQQFLMGRATGMQLIESGDPMAAFLGSEIVKRAGGEGYVFDPAERSRIMADIVGDKNISEQLRLMARRTMGFRIILEDLNTYLFNPEAGVFGALRKVMDSAGNPTTMFDEVEKLTESVFGKDGMFAKLVKAIRSVFGDYDPMRPFIDGIQLMQRVFDAIGRYFESSGFKRIVEVAKDVFDGVSKVFTGLYEQIGSGNFDPRQITEGITDFNEAIREYVKSLGRTIRGEDVSKQGEFAGTVLGTLVEEVGKTSIVLIKELFATFINKVPEIATKVLPALNDGINKMLTEVFGNELAGKVLKFVLGFVPGPIGAVARASTAGDLTGGGGNILSMLAMGGAALLGTGAGAKLFGAVKGVGNLGFGAARVGRGIFGPDEARMDLLNSLTSRTNRVEEIYNRRMRALYLPGAQRVPLSGLLGRILSPRGGFRSNLPEDYYPPGTPRYPYSDVLGGPNKLKSDVLSGPYPLKSPIPIGPYSELGKITAQSTMFTPLPEYTLSGFMQGERARRESVIAESKKLSVMEGMERYKSSIVQPYGPSSSAFKYYDVPEYLTKTPFDYTGYVTPIGPQPHGAPWAYAPGMSDIGGDYAPFMESQYISPAERETKRRLAASERYKRMYESGSLGRMRRRNLIKGITKPGRMAMVGLGAAGIITGMTMFGGSAKAQSFDPATGQFVEQEKPATGAGAAWGAVGAGALAGAEMGSMFGPWGTAIGTVIGGALPLLDKGVRDAIGKSIGEFFNNIKKFFGDLGNSISQSWGNFTNWVGESLSWAGNALKDALKWAVNGIIGGLNMVLSNMTLLPRTMTQAIKGLVESIKIPFPGKETALKALGGIESFFSPQIPNFASGRNYLGPALALEARMSGRRPMVVNDGEFVIPKDGFPILAGLVGQNLRSTGVIGSANNNTPTQVNVSLSLTTHSVVANADELVETMREPVYKIISDAIKEVENSRISRTATA